MGGEKKARVAGAREHVRELARRVSPLGRIEPDADDAVAKRQRRVEGALGVGFIEMAQEAHDQACRYAELAPGIGNGAAKTFDHGRERDAAGGVALRVEEHFDVADVVGVGALEIGEGKVVEILLRHQHRHAEVVDVEEILQVAEPIRLPHRVDRRIRQ